MSNNGKLQNPDALHPSTPDTVALVDAVGARYEQLRREWKRIRGVDLKIPKTLHIELGIVKKVWSRHRSGDMRNSLSELRATKVLAQWTVDVNKVLRNQEPEIIEWKD